MIKKKIGIDNNFALKEACKNNDIILTDKGINSQPVSYIDLTGKEKILNSKLNANYTIKNVASKHLNEGVEFSVGDTVRIHTKFIKDNQECIQEYQGTVIKRQHSGVKETFTVRKNSNGVGVEKTWPLHSQEIDKIEVVRKGNARRAKLFYKVKEKEEKKHSG